MTIRAATVRKRAAKPRRGGDSSGRSLFRASGTLTCHFPSPPPGAPPPLPEVGEAMIVAHTVTILVGAPPVAERRCREPVPARGGAALRTRCPVRPNACHPVREYPNDLDHPPPLKHPRIRPRIKKPTESPRDKVPARSTAKRFNNIARGRRAAAHPGSPCQTPSEPCKGSTMDPGLFTPFRLGES